jgi:predicted transcriptional regulator
MQSTTIRVSAETRDAVKALAEVDDRTLDQQIALMARRERQRAMGQALARAVLDAPDLAVLDAPDLAVLEAGIRTVDAEIR